MVGQPAHIGGSWRFRSLLGWLRASLSRKSELAYLSPQDIDAIARELNLSTSAFRTLAQSPSASELLRKRLALAGFSEHALAAGHGDVLRDLQRVCGLCPAKGRCAADLQAGMHRNPLKDCPNEHTLCALGREVDDGRPQRFRD